MDWIFFAKRPFCVQCTQLTASFSFSDQEKVTVFAFLAFLYKNKLKLLPKLILLIKHHSPFIAKPDIYIMQLKNVYRFGSIGC